MLNFLYITWAYQIWYVSHLISEFKEVMRPCDGVTRIPTVNEMLYLCFGDPSVTFFRDPQSRFRHISLYYSRSMTSDESDLNQYREITHDYKSRGSQDFRVHSIELILRLK